MAPRLDHPQRLGVNEHAGDDEYRVGPKLVTGTEDAFAGEPDRFLGRERFAEFAVPVELRRRVEMKPVIEVEVGHVHAEPDERITPTERDILHAEGWAGANEEDTHFRICPGVVTSTSNKPPW